MSTYENLIYQYDNLTNEEKNAILIYKSRLFYILNLVTQVEDFNNLSGKEIAAKIDNFDQCVKILDDYAKVLNNGKNMFMKFSVFSGVNLTNIEDFINDAKKIIAILKVASKKITLQNDIIVYRGVCTNSKDYKLVGNGEFISTSLKLEDAYKFLYSSDVKNDEKHLFMMRLNAGIDVLVTPYNIVRTYSDGENYISHKLNGVETDVLKIVKLDDIGQKEITLISDSVIFSEIETKIVGDNHDINYHVIDVRVKEKEKDILL